MTVKHWMLSIFTAGLLILVTVLVTLYASGYRFDLTNASLQGTGIISISSVPDGALVYLNGVPEDATDASITGLKPGTYNLRLEKQGFATWEKQVEVKKELVTSEKALLVPLFPELKPLTFTGVQRTFLSPDGQKILYTAQRNNGSDGIWLLQLNERPFGLTSRARLLLEDTRLVKYSQAELSWQPDGGGFLIRLPKRSLLYDLASGQSRGVEDFEKLRKDWLTQEQEARAKLLENYPDEVKAEINSLPNWEWSPDKSKILFERGTDTKIEFWVLDLKPKVVEMTSKPQPREYKSLAFDKNKFAKVSWFADSEHLLILEKESRDAQNGTISLVELDGSNKTNVFSGTIIDTVVYPSPDGSKIILLTNFNPANQQNNLYAIGLH